MARVAGGAFAVEVLESVGVAVGLAVCVTVGFAVDALVSVMATSTVPPVTPTVMPTPTVISIVAVMIGVVRLILSERAFDRVFIARKRDVGGRVGVDDSDRSRGVPRDDFDDAFGEDASAIFGSSGERSE